MDRSGVCKFLHHPYKSNKYQSVLKNLKNPIVRIDANNSSDKMRKLSTNRCGQLFNVIFLAREEKVTLAFNLCPEIGLANGSTGKVVDIKYRYYESPQNKNIPYCICVDMDDYTSAPFFPHPERKKWILIYARTHTELFKKRDDWVEKSRTMIPLILDWAWNIHKTQDQNIRNKIVLSLGNKEMAHGLTYVAISRAT